METSTPDVTPALFDMSAGFTINLKRYGKTAICTFPTDEQYAARQASMRTLIQRVGIGGSTTETQGIEASAAELLKKIQTGGDTDLDEAQAAVVIERLMKSDADEAVQAAEGFMIRLRVPGAVTEHTLRVPSEKELRSYRREAFKFVDQRHGRQELKSNMPRIGSFYDTVLVHTSGYNGPVPLCHKVTVITELTTALDLLDAEDDPENF